MNEEEKLALLKNILLTDEREYAQDIANKLNTLEHTISEREQLADKINPIIQAELDKFSKSIPTTLGPTITKSIKNQIAESRDEVVEALYPIMGIMIKKYISQEIKVVAEKINNAAKQNLSIKSLKRKFTSLFTGVNENEILLSELAKAQIEQVFVIEKDSGILLGSYQIKKTIDQDMISGMLTAIKAFVEDAFTASGHNLQSIAYDLYEIHLDSFHKYYIATAISGTFTETLESKLENYNLEVSKEINKKNIANSREQLDELLSSKYKALSLADS